MHAGNEQFRCFTVKGETAMEFLRCCPYCKAEMCEGYVSDPYEIFLSVCPVCQYVAVV